MALVNNATKRILIYEWKIVLGTLRITVEKSRVKCYKHVKARYGLYTFFLMNNFTWRYSNLCLLWEGDHIQQVCIREINPRSSEWHFIRRTSFCPCDVVAVVFGQYVCLLKIRSRFQIPEAVKKIFQGYVTITAVTWLKAMINYHY